MLNDKVYLVKLFGICSYVAVGSPCLVRDDDDIWYDATIMEILDDAQFHIQFKANHHTKTISVKDLFPLSKSSILSCLFICLKWPTAVSMYPSDLNAKLTFHQHLFFLTRAGLGVPIGKYLEELLYKWLESKLMTYCFWRYLTVWIGQVFQYSFSACSTFTAAPEDWFPVYVWKLSSFISTFLYLNCFKGFVISTVLVR